MGWIEYIKRWRKAGKFQRKVIGMVIDWTVFLYLVIPVIIALAVIDYQLWQSPPAWTSFIPVHLFGLVFFYIAQFFSIRTYVEQADELFVIQKGDYYQSLLQLGKYFSVLKAMLAASILIFYFYPVFKTGYQLSIFTVLLILFYVVVWSLFRKLAARWFSLRGIIWRRRVFSVFEFMLYGIGMYGLFHHQLVFLSMMLPIFGAVVFFLKKERQPLRYFHAEAERERSEKWKWAVFLMVQSGEYEGIKKTRKYPLFNKQSQEIFSKRIPEHVLAEMYWKWHFRKGRHLKFYLYFVLFSFYALAVLPEKVQFFVLAFILFAGFKIQDGIWKSFITHPFTRNIGPINETSLVKGKRLAFLVLWLIPCGMLMIWALFV